jgi:mannose-6-phosphate isomerase-like protein (cupin superfamily)
MLTPTQVDLAAVDLSGPNGVVWSLPPGGDLNANLVQLTAGAAIGSHVNEEVDVLLIGIDGAGSVVVDNATYDLHPGTIVAVPRYASRHIAADSNRELVYLTVHVARLSLRIRPRYTAVPEENIAPPKEHR